MASPELIHPEIEPVTFRLAYRAVMDKIIELGSSDLDIAEEEHEWGFLSETRHIPDTTIVGQQATVKGRNDGVAHHIRLAAFNEALGLVEGQSDFIDIRVYANEGDVIPYDGDDKGGSAEGQGTLRGLIWFNRNGTIDADFGHGTGPSTDPNVQRRMEKLLGIFGLTPDIIENQSFEYDEEAAQDLVQSLPSLSRSI